MTTNLDLIKLAKKNKIQLDYILYKDELIKIPYKAGLSIILNMSSTGHPGTHWVALHTYKDLTVYFDSFGIEPPVEVINWSLNRNAGFPHSLNRVLYSDFQLEELDGINCGQIALFCLKLSQN